MYVCTIIFSKILKIKYGERAQTLPTLHKLFHTLFSPHPQPLFYLVGTLEKAHKAGDPLPAQAQERRGLPREKAWPAQTRLQLQEKQTLSLRRLLFLRCRRPRRGRTPGQANYRHDD